MLSRVKSHVIIPQRSARPVSPFHTTGLIVCIVAGDTASDVSDRNGWDWVLASLLIVKLPDLHETPAIVVSFKAICMCRR